MILQTTHLDIGYGRHAVQTDLNLAISRPEMISLIGTNGTGKSTLLRTLSGLQPPLAGTISIADRQLARISSAAKARLISIVLTDTFTTEHMTVYELVAMGRIPYTSWADRLSHDDDAIIRRAIQDVNLAFKTDSPITELSDGERQRATIARALAQDTPLILLDEPTSHLDLPNRIEIMLLLKQLAEQQGKSIIISTHEVNLALQTSHTIWLLTREQALIAAPPADMIANPVFVSAFSSDKYEILPTGDYRLIR